MAERYRIKFRDEEKIWNNSEIWNEKNALKLQEIIPQTKDVELLRKASEHPVWRIRNMVAKNPNTPVDVLKKTLQFKV